MSMKMEEMPGIGNVALVAIFLAAVVFGNFMICCASDELQAYTPVHSLGSGADDWWINYPDHSPNASLPVKHLPWVNESLKEKPVVILDRKLDCPACEEQKTSLEKVLKNYSGNVTYFDIVAEEDIRAYEVIPVYYWEPKVPATVVLTLVRDSDRKVAVGWHTMNNAMDEGIIDSYIKDAIYYYRQNVADLSSS